MRHHPACPSGAHVHPVDTTFHISGYAVFVDRDTVLLTPERLVAHRVAQLVNAHGLCDVPDTIPADVLWAPPDPNDQIVDFRLPEPGDL